jgi:hypothetical protein
MIVGLMQKEDTYHFFETKETALSLMVPNVGLKWKQKKDAVNTFKASSDNWWTSHFYQPDMWHPIDEAVTVCTETLFSRCQGG